MDRLVAMFGEDQAARLAKISLRQLRYWYRTAFFLPSLAAPGEEGQGPRLYTFDDVVSLRVLGVLRNTYNVSLQHLRKVRDRLKLDQSDWANSSIFVLKNNVYFENNTGGATNGETGEDTLPHIPLRVVIEDVQKDVKALKERSAEQIGKQSKTRTIARNALVFAGTRIPVSMVKEYLDAGYGLDDVLRQYPLLTEKDISFAIDKLGIKVA